MTKVRRYGIFGGRRPGEWCHHITCGVRSDGTSPARDFWEKLSQGEWEEDPLSPTIPDDEQVKDRDALRHKMRFLAEQGEPERATDVNLLQNGVWEFKHGNKRIAFADTDGQGGFKPKGKIQERSDSPDPDSPCWWFPEMDEHLRLLNAWPKVSQRADPEDIHTAETIAKEDREHDQQ